VLCQEVVDILRPAAPGLLIDATVGLGGHASALLDAEPGFELLGLDRDPSALRVAAQRLARHTGRFTLLNRRFGDLPELFEDLPAPAAILVDLGVSSLQLDNASRGFSFASDGPLDMRMENEGPTAAELVNTLPEDELMRILWDFGEEKTARKISRAIKERREHKAFETTGELSRLVQQVIGRRRGDRIHPATRTFQALRIAVNDELRQLEKMLEPAVLALRDRGRLAAISFHSLEDRIVKHTLRQLEGRCTCPPDLPRCACGAELKASVLTKRPVRPTDEEVETNPRARSARLRATERHRDPGS
jgi:16S rRNA (cytosine1402-N4)-methyltransferase